MFRGQSWIITSLHCSSSRALFLAASSSSLFLSSPKEANERTEMRIITQTEKVLYSLPIDSQTTPPPSVEPQFSLFEWAQSKMLFSVPSHLTSSKLNVFETAPKADLEVATEFVGSNPSILQITLASKLSQ